MTTLPKDKHALVIQGSEEEKKQACIEIRDWAVKNNITMPAILTYESILNFSHCNYILWNGTCLDACLRNFSVVGYTIHHTVESFMKVFEGEGSPNGIIHFENVQQKLIELMADYLDSEDLKIDEAASGYKDPIPREESELHIRMAKAAYREYKSTIQEFNPHRTEKFNQP